MAGRAGVIGMGFIIGLKSHSDFLKVKKCIRKSEGESDDTKYAL